VSSCREKIIIRFCWHKKMCAGSVPFVTCNNDKIRKKERKLLEDKIRILIGKQKREDE
jgi:hypothetical protein